MAFSSMKHVVLLLALSLFIFIYEVEADSNLRRHEIYLFSELPNDSEPLLVHCRSKDNDLGSHALRSGDVFDWHFRTNFFATTLYSCDFAWGLKKKGMVVFSAAWPYYHTYNYVVRPDGFYVGHDQKNPKDYLEFSQKWDD